MKKIYLNKELSIEIYDKEIYDKGKYTPKHCYDNVFDNIGSVGFRFKEEDIKVMFSYVSILSLEKTYARHACFYLDGMAIDPTLVSVYGEDIDWCNTHYIPFRILTVNEYLKLVAREHRADLFKTFKVVENLRRKELKGYGITLIG